MCGICGIVNFPAERPVERQRLERMSAEIFHRGPDEDGFLIKGNVGLAMRRLSIVDVKGGHQPVTNEDETISVLYNGEIYNHASLREQMLAKGHRYKTRSDTESIVHLYEEYGEQAVEHLQGMFAFTLWDARRRALLIARDRLGIKPLYYWFDGRTLVYGSEIKAILASGLVSPELAPDVLPEYLAFGYLAGERTFFKGIRKLMPGHTLTVDHTGSLDIHQYWDVPQHTPMHLSETECVREYRSRLEETVIAHLMADVPLGVFLSGGLDSSAVAAIAAKHHDGPLKTFSVGYDDEQYSELRFARQVAQHIGADHHEIKVSEDDFFTSLPTLVWHEDSPPMGPASVPLYFVAKLSREHVKVVLSGEGSDETMAGYSRYAFTLLNAKFNRVYDVLTPAALQRAVSKQIREGAGLSANWRRKLSHSFLAKDGGFFESMYLDNFFAAFSESEQHMLFTDPGYVKNVYSDSVCHLESYSGDLLSRLLYLDLKTYLVELLMKQDQMSMAASVESRVPFLDHKLVEFATQIPSALKTKGTSGKWILKNGVADLLPEDIVHRKKLGFPTPWERWLHGARLQEIENLVLAPDSLCRQFFRPEYVRSIFHQQRTGIRKNYDRIWRLLTLELWHRVFIADGYKKPYLNSSAATLTTL
jgi:asparagine synthase (glutamine-hydrolysing)